jgi:flagellar hook-length control protein FliK
MKMMISQVINDLALKTQNATSTASLPGSSDGEAVAFLDLLTALSSRQSECDKKPKPDDIVNAIIASLMAMSGAAFANDSEMSVADSGNSGFTDAEFNGNDGLSKSNGLLLEMINGDDSGLQGAIRNMAAQQEGVITWLTELAKKGYLSVPSWEDDTGLVTAANAKQADKPDDSSLYRLMQMLGNGDISMLYDIINGLVGNHEGTAIEPIMDGTAAKLAEMGGKADLPTFLELDERGVGTAAYAEQADKLSESNLGRLLQALEQKGVDIADAKLKLAMLSNAGHDPAELKSSVNEDSQGLAASSDVISAKASHNITEPLSMAAENNMELEHDMNVGDVESAKQDQPDSRQLYNSTIDNVDDIALNKANHAGMPSNDITGIDTQKIDVPLKDAANTMIDELQRYLLANKQPASSGKMIFQLQPENMGHIAIEMRYMEGTLSAHIIADTLAAYQLIDDNLNQLQQAVQRSGFDSTQLTLTLSQHNMQETWSNSGGWAERHQYNGGNYSELSTFNEPMYYNTEKLWDVWDEHSSINQYI